MFLNIAVLTVGYPELNTAENLENPRLFRARSVNKESLAMLLNMEPEDIYRFSCWRHVIHVVGRNLSRFVSYADLPPILGVEPPMPQDAVCWRKRWRKNESRQAPAFWMEFYAKKFRRAVDLDELYAWAELVAAIALRARYAIAFGLSAAAVELLKGVFAQEQEYCHLSF